MLEKFRKYFTKVFKKKIVEEPDKSIVFISFTVPDNYIFQEQNENNYLSNSDLAKFGNPLVNYSDAYYVVIKKELSYLKNIDFYIETFKKFSQMPFLNILSQNENSSKIIEQYNSGNITNFHIKNPINLHSRKSTRNKKIEGAYGSIYRVGSKDNSLDGDGCSVKDEFIIKISIYSDIKTRDTERKLIQNISNIKPNVTVKYHDIQDFNFKNQESNNKYYVLLTAMDNGGCNLFIYINSLKQILQQQELCNLLIKVFTKIFSLISLLFDNNFYGCDFKLENCVINVNPNSIDDSIETIKLIDFTPIFFLDNLNSDEISQLKTLIVLSFLHDFSCIYDMQNYFELYDFVYTHPLFTPNFNFKQIWAKIAKINVIDNYLFGTFSQKKTCLKKILDQKKSVNNPDFFYTLNDKELVLQENYEEYLKIKKQLETSNEKSNETFNEIGHKKSRSKKPKRSKGSKKPKMLRGSKRLKKNKSRK